MKWYLLQCKTQQHTRAQQHLDNQGFEFYSPVHKIRKLVKTRSRSAINSQNTPRMETLLEPLFPGYLFIHLNDQSNWHALQSTRGVIRLVSFNGSPHCVPDSLVAALRQRLDENSAPQPLYRPGERVVITEGCFRHVEAIVEAVTSDERIVVLMKILHSEQMLTFEPALLARAG